MAVINRPNGLSGATGPRLLTAGPYISSDTAIYVDSVTGSDSNTGLREELPKATVFGAAGAISVCTGGLAHLIACLKTHREEIAAAYTWSKGGITLVSLGEGTDRATFTSAVAGAAITASGTEVRMENVLFAASSAATTRFVNFTGANGELRDCRFEMGANDYTDGVLVNAVSGVAIRDCVFIATAAVASGTTRVGVRVTGAATNALIEDCTFDGGIYGWSSGYALRIESSTTDGYRIRGCTIQNRSIIGVASGAKGYTSDITSDASSRFEMTE